MYVIADTEIQTSASPLRDIIRLRALVLDMNHGCNGNMAVSENGVYPQL